MVAVAVMYVDCSELLKCICYTWISESERMIHMCDIWNGALKVKMSDPRDFCATIGDRGDRDRESVALMGANALMFCHN